MAFKWTEGDHRSGNILDADEFNTSFNNVKGEINGGLDRENLPNTSVSNEELASDAMVKYVVKSGMRAQNTTYSNAIFTDGSTLIPQSVRAFNYNRYSGGWRTNEAEKITNEIFQEGMLHIEYNGWYWLRNHVATASSARNTNEKHCQIWCQFQITLDGTPVITGGKHYQNVGQIHLVGDVPISTGKHDIALRWRFASWPGSFPSGATTITQPVFYYDGGQLTVINRYR